MLRNELNGMMCLTGILLSGHTYLFFYSRTFYKHFVWLLMAPIIFLLVILYPLLAMKIDEERWLENKRIEEIRHKKPRKGIRARKKVLLSVALLIFIALIAILKIVKMLIVGRLRRLAKKTNK